MDTMELLMVIATATIAISTAVNVFFFYRYTRANVAMQYLHILFTRNKHLNENQQFLLNLIGKVKDEKTGDSLKDVVESSKRGYNKEIDILNGIAKKACLSKFVPDSEQFKIKSRDDDQNKK